MISVKLYLPLLCLLGTLIKGSLAHEEHLEVAFKQVTLKDICANRLVPIMGVSDVKRYIAELMADDSACPKDYIQSFMELQPILNLDDDQLLCGERKFNQIAEYHFRYINPMKETFKFGDDLNKLEKVINRKALHEEKFDYGVHQDQYKQVIQIPIALQQFFKAWALQVSGLCKRAFIDNLEYVSQSSLTLADVDIINNIKQENGPKKVKKFKKKSSSKKADEATDAEPDLNGITFEDVAYLPELEGELEEGDIESKKQLVRLDFTDQPDLNYFYHSCLLRFKPIYDQLVMPVVKLVKLGYDYQGQEIIDIRSSLDSRDSKAWLALASACEAFGNYKITSQVPENLKKLSYTPTFSYSIEDKLWIKGSEGLTKELELISNSKKTGFKKLIFKTGIAGRKAVAYIDPHRSAWYRKNQNTVSSGLNSLSIVSNIFSIAVSFLGG